LAVKGIGAAGGLLGGLASGVTREKRIWNKLVDEHKMIRKRLDNRPDDESLQKREALIHQEKIKARQKYIEIKNKYKSKAEAMSKRAASRTGRAVSNTGSKVHNYVISNFHR